MGGGVSSQKNFPLFISLTRNETDAEKTEYKKLYPCWSIALIPNGKQLAAATSDNKIHLWCLMTYQLLISLTGHGDTIWSVQYSPDCQLLASASSDGTIRLWEVDTGFPLNILRAHANWVWNIQFAPDSRNFISAGADTRIFLWDCDQELPLLGKSGHLKSVNAVAFSPKDSRKLATVGADGLLCVWHVNWDAPSCELRARLEGHLGTVNSVAISPANDNLIVTVGEDAIVRLWNMKDLTKETAYRSISVSHGYNMEHHLLTGHTEAVWKVCFSQCGKIAATVSSDMSVRIWNISAKKPSLNCVFKAHESWVRDCVFAKDNQYLYTCSTDGLVSLWVVPKKYRIKAMDNELM